MSSPLTDYLLSLGPTLLGVSSEELSAALSETAARAAIQKFTGDAQVELLHLEATPSGCRCRTTTARR